MEKLNLALIRGGFGRSKEDSIRSGAFILNHLQSHEKYNGVTDILVDRDGWHVNGSKINPEKILSNHKYVFFNILSEKEAEDFKVRKLIERHGVRSNGSSTFSSLLAYNKHLAKKFFTGAGIKTPKHELISVDDDIEKKAFEIFRTFTLPVLIKSSRGGGSSGVTFARTFGEIVFGIRNAFAYSPKVMVEEYIKGREISCTILENFRDQNLYVFPLAEILKKNEIVDMEMKRTGNYKSIFPARLNRDESELIRNVAVKAHKTLGLRHYSRADLIFSPRGIYLLEINSSPEFNGGSLFQQSLEEGGVSTKQFLDHVINLALEKK